MRGLTRAAAGGDGGGACALTACDGRTGCDVRLAVRSTMTEVDPENVRSRCCHAPVRAGLGLTMQGVASVAMCTACQNYCSTERWFTGLPAPGTFERPLKPKRDITRYDT